MKFKQVIKIIKSILNTAYDVSSNDLASIIRIKKENKSKTIFLFVSQKSIFEALKKIHVENTIKNVTPIKPDDEIAYSIPFEAV